MGELAAVCAYFNPCNYKARRRNYDLFRSQIEASGVPLLTVELVSQPYTSVGLGGYGDVLTITGGDVLWQKERLLQIGIDTLIADGWDAVVWLDADIVFQDKAWPDRINRSLGSYDCVQSFSKIISHFTRLDCAEPSIVHRPWSRAAGGSWAATSDFWRAVPLYQHCIVGGGDTVMAKVMLDFAAHEPRIWSWNYRNPTMTRLNQRMRDHIVDWARQVWGNWRIGFVVDQVAHLLPHGARAQRAYAQRHDILRDFDPLADLQVAPSGAWIWSTAKPELHQAVRDYFLDRKEDG